MQNVAYESLQKERDHAVPASVSRNCVSETAEIEKNEDRAMIILHDLSSMGRDPQAHHIHSYESSLEELITIRMIVYN